MKRFINIVLYISAFLPMFVVMWLKEVITIAIKVYNRWQKCSIIEWSYFLNWFLIIELFVIVVIALCFCLLLRGNGEMGTNTIKVCGVKNQTAEYYLSYYTLFVLSLIGFSLVDIVDVFVLCLLLTLLGIVYIRNGLYHLNPTINIVRSLLFEVQYDVGTADKPKITSKVVISKEKIYLGDVIEIYISEFDYTLMKKKITE